MGYRSTKECIEDLEKAGHVLRISAEVDPNLEMAEIQRRIYLKQGPAILFENVKGSKFPCVSNLFGTVERTKYIFRDSYDSVCSLLKCKADPSPLKKPLFAIKAASKAFKGLPKKLSNSKAPVMANECNIEDLPQIVSWPDDGGAFITLPQVYSEDPAHPGKPVKSNLGMYRIQLSGNDYEKNREIGLHYQIHRGIGVHQSETITAGKPFRVAIFVGGPPANTFCAVLPLPEGMPEVAFAGLLNNQRFRYTRYQDWTLAADADFCIIGTIDDELKPEGPFGDHLGYYSLKHDFPCMKVEKVFHRDNAVWPFTVVGRPPQEDTSFGAVIHDMTGPVLPTEINGLKAINAVDAAGVHPLLLAIGKERYTPYKKVERPQELLTIANAILGKGQLSLAKYLFIVAEEDAPDLDIHHIDQYLIHMLERIDWQRDLHFQTNTNIDTLDYSGEDINYGSKVIFAACGDKRRDLASDLPELNLPEEFGQAAICLPGVIALTSPAFTDQENSKSQIEELCNSIRGKLDNKKYPLVILCDDAQFSSATLNNFLWTVFTRSNPSHDIYGVDEFVRHKHWGCEGSLIIDARIKSHHAPPLIENPEVSKKVDSYFAPGGILEKWS